MDVFVSNLRLIFSHRPREFPGRVGLGDLLVQFYPALRNFLTKSPKTGLNFSLYFEWFSGPSAQGSTKVRYYRTAYHKPSLRYYRTEYRMLNRYRKNTAVFQYRCFSLRYYRNNAIFEKGYRISVPIL